MRAEQLESRLCMSAVPVSGSEDVTVPLQAVNTPAVAIQPIAVTAPRVGAVYAPPASKFQSISLSGPNVVGKGSDAIYTVKLLQAPGEKTVTIAYTTRNIGAKDGINYTKTSGTLTFTGNETEKTIRVPALATSPDQQKPATFALDLSPAKDAGKLIPVNGKILNKSMVTRIIPPVPPSAPGSDFQIVVKFPDSSLTVDEQQVFQQAAYRWTEIIVGKLSPVAGQLADVEILATAPTIDGEGGILGQAGPTDFRNDASRLPFKGIMEFDSSDVDVMYSDGTFYNVILHEMAHVLGFGTLWQSKGLISGAGGTNPLFTGTNALREYRTLSSRPTATGVPLETTGGSGTRDAHWLESTFRIELMTGFAEAAGVRMPISRMTVGQFEDLGYKVNYAKADAYTIGATSIVAPSRLSSSPTTAGGGTFLVSSQSLPALNAAVASAQSATQQMFAAAIARPKARSAA